MSDIPFRRISVIGLGYIGLPIAAMFALRKVEVLGVDVSQHAVDTINRGEVHIFEPDLEAVVREVVREGYLRATTVPEPADVFLIAVPTPCEGETHDPDLRFVRAAACSIAPMLERGNLVILESTSPVGTTQAMADWLAEARPDLTFPQTAGEMSDIRIAHCPERVLPGNIMQELIANDRVIGGMTPACSSLAVSLYRLIVKGDCVVATTPRVAEMAKLAENSFRDVNIAFANEVSLICDELDINVWELIALANRHPRVNILQPGPGVGGHCIAVDPWFVAASAPDRARLIRTAREVNDSKSEWVLGKVCEAIEAQRLQGAGRSACEITVAIYGLAFKANIDDLRESPALKIARGLAAVHKGPLLIVEPNINVLADGLAAAKLASLQEARSADVHVMLVDHRSFKEALRPTGRIVDVRGVWCE